MNQHQELRVAFVDDDALEVARFQQQVELCRGHIKYLASCFSSPEQYLAALDAGCDFDIAILDIHFGAGSILNGIDLTEKTRKKIPDALILVRTSDLNVVRKALIAGADDFLDKIKNEQDLLLRLPITYSAKLSLSEKNQISHFNYNFPLLGESTQKIGGRVPRIAQSAVRSVHINGESGTGKELVAQMFEEVANRVPFIKLNCAAVAPTLLESELFGHAKGAFTGANWDKKGYVEAADGGWLFLDEIAELSLNAQAALLRVLETGEFNRLGESTKVRKSNIRLLTATHENIRKLVAEQKFRNDLWQRICEVEIKLIPLRDRMEEIQELATNFARSMEGGPYELTAPTLSILTNYTWKDGNVRELRNCIRSMTEFQIDKKLTPMSIPSRIWQRIDNHRDLSSSSGHSSQDYSESALIIPIQENEEISARKIQDRALLEYIRFLFDRNGKQSLRQWANQLNLSRNMLSPKLKSFVQLNWISKDELLTMVDLII